MTDDSLLRGVIASPADPAPRLIYADWLDDHDDPRGAFLRTEVDWAKRKGKRKLAELRKLAATLDPVWATRVSRPPLGVCCDRMKIHNPGPELTPADLDALEKRLAVRLPAEFRAFYLNWNGGTPWPPYIPDPRPDWEDLPIEISDFYQAGELAKELRFLHSLGEYLREPSDDVPLIRDMVMFAYTPNDLGYFFIGVGAANFGRIFHFTDFCHNLDEPDHLRDMAGSLGELLSQIRNEQ
jgi:uncharacterized protein (TIGR02996 family)